MKCGPEDCISPAMTTRVMRQQSVHAANTTGWLAGCGARGLRLLTHEGGKRKGRTITITCHLVEDEGVEGGGKFSILSSECDNYTCLIEGPRLLSGVNISSLLCLTMRPRECKMKCFKVSDERLR